MAEKNIMISIDDEKAGKIAEILTNKTSKKILSYLADKEASESDIAKELNLPANTVNYNIKKLIESGLIESSKTFFWSVKGKKMPQYKVSRKTIIISTKTNSNKILGAFLITGIFAALIKVYYSSITQVNTTSGSLAENSYDAAIAVGEKIAPSTQPSLIQNLPVEVWPWFLLGGITALLFYMILNWKKL